MCKTFFDLHTAAEMINRRGSFKTAGTKKVCLTLPILISPLQHQQKDGETLQSGDTEWRETKKAPLWIVSAY